MEVMTASATVDTRPNVCPRCNGILIKYFDDDRECLQCGFVAYAHPPHPVDPTKRERPPTYKGMEL
jgi:ribosomal protein S27AE